MSYCLNFWRYQDGVYLDNQEVYEKLSNGETIEGLEDIPISDILDRISDVFTNGWEKLDDLNWESGNGAFQIFTTIQFIRIDCYGMEGEDMNRFIDIADEFNCPLYDPQARKRFDGR